jgi:hypothetical protein
VWECPTDYLKYKEPHPALSKGEGSNKKVLSFGEDLGEAFRKFTKP